MRNPCLARESASSFQPRGDLILTLIFQEKDIIPIPNQSAIFVGFVEGSSTYLLYAFVAFFLAALISSLI